VLSGGGPKKILDELHAQSFSVGQKGEKETGHSLKFPSAALAAAAWSNANVLSLLVPPAGGQLVRLRAGYEPGDW
jgi:hypothetical protein